MQSDMSSQPTDIFSAKPQTNFSNRALWFDNWLVAHQNQVEHTLDTLMPRADAVPTDLHQAMRWAALGGGKRIRAALLYASGQACCQSLDLPIQNSLNVAAAAVELVHAYSLIHDDLPCMDDDILRRGKPTTHVKFGEAVALLAGDAMQPLAFEWLAHMPIAPTLTVQSVQCFSTALGSLGMAGGQAIDLASTDKKLNETDLAHMHRLKTGALLEASVALGAIITSANVKQQQALKIYAQAIGLAFQVVDDVLDATANTAQLGKTAGKDEHDHKSTYVSLMGVDQAQAFAVALYDQAVAAILPFGEQGVALRGLAYFIVYRSH
jgi:farnesyl diphosphate synthase